MEGPAGPGAPQDTIGHEEPHFHPHSSCQCQLENWIFVEELNVFLDMKKKINMNKYLPLSQLRETNFCNSTPTMFKKKKEIQTMFDITKVHFDWTLSKGSGGKGRGNKMMKLDAS